MKLIYDPEADAASIYLIDSIPPGGTAKSHVCDVELTDCAVILDFDAADKLIGIELLGASRLLPRVLLTENDRTTDSGQAG